MEPRTIVMLSDGTGNSSAKITKTNVWRIYQAIDLSQKDQLAVYDDGVGSGGFKIVRYLGGAFGLGLARNVRELYEYLCRHYSEDDKIVLLGFSRGAFTVRVLSGLIERCGIIDRSPEKTVRVWRWSRLGFEDLSVATDEGLKAAVRLAYRSLRKRYQNAPVSRFFRRLRDRTPFRTPDTQQFHKKHGLSQLPRIAFLGVFDTVSAYGLPVDEMAIAIHKWIFPLRFPDMILSKKVHHAYQALALDEARQTFHPMLWTERNPITGKSDFRPRQVWFPGMHSDVGGGYGDDRLSLLPAVWMLEQLQHCMGLRLREDDLDALRTRATPLGVLHDSRSGFSAFYRYKPRLLEALGKEDLDGNNVVEVQVDRCKIHEAVFERIKATRADYAPIGIPRDYEMVPSAAKADSSNESLSADDAGYETKEQRARRWQIQRGIEDLIFWRRILYFVMAGIALAIIVAPLVNTPNPAAITEGVAATVVGFVAWAASYLPVPKSEEIGQFWTQHPWWFIGLAVGFALTYKSSSSVARAMAKRAQDAWAHVAGRAAPEVETKPGLVEAWRKLFGGPYKCWTKRTLPLLVVFFLFLVIPAVVFWRWFLFAPLDFDSVCQYVHAESGYVPPRAANSEGRFHAEFDTEKPCSNTGTELVEGREYTITITTDGNWHDGSFPADPTGLRWREIGLKWRFVMEFLRLTRRFFGEDWFAMMGSIGRAREYAFAIDARPVEGSSNTFTYDFHAWRSGRLYLFVNDGLNALGRWGPCGGPIDTAESWRCYYDNNRGSARITIAEKRER